MGALSFPALKDRPGRIDTFITKFSDGDEFVFTDGTAQVLSGVEYLLKKMLCLVGLYDSL